MNFPKFIFLSNKCEIFLHILSRYVFDTKTYLTIAAFGDQSLISVPIGFRLVFLHF